MLWVMRDPATGLPPWLLGVALLAGCPRSAPQPVPDPVVPADPTVACARDEDCAVSCLQRDACCDQLCDCTNVYNREALRRLESERGARCSEACPIASCVEPTERTVAHCVQGACQGQRLPALRPPG